MIRLLESSLEADKLQKQIDKLEKKRAKLQADLDKRNLKKQRRVDTFDKDTAKAVKKIKEAISKADRDTVNPEAIAVVEEMLRKLEPMSLDDWVDYSLAYSDKRCEFLKEGVTDLARLNNRQRFELGDIPAPENDPYGRVSITSDLSWEVNERFWELRSLAEDYGQNLRNIYKTEQELSQLETQIEQYADQLEKLTFSDEYLNYAPPEFWDFVDKATKETILYWKSQNWRSEEYDPRTGKTVVFTVTQKDIESWYEAAAKETIYRVSHKAGRIREVRYMKLGTNLRVFDGTYVCENRTVTAQTIIAGGWNIQREHTRVLIS